MSHRRKRKEKPEVNKNVREVSGKEDYDTSRMLLFQAAEGLRELIGESGVDVGEIKDCAPLAQFRCKNCRSEQTAIYIYANAVALVCIKCNTMEVVGSPKSSEKIN